MIRALLYILIAFIALSIVASCVGYENVAKDTATTLVNPEGEQAVVKPEGDTLKLLSVIPLNIPPENLWQVRIRQELLPKLSRILTVSIYCLILGIASSMALQNPVIQPIANAAAITGGIGIAASLLTLKLMSMLSSPAATILITIALLLVGAIMVRKMSGRGLRIRLLSSLPWSSSSSSPSGEEAVEEILHPEEEQPQEESVSESPPPPEDPVQINKDTIM